MHLTLLLEHFDLLLVNKLLNALKLCEVFFLVLLYEYLQSRFCCCDLASHLFLWCLAALFLSFKLFSSLVLRCKKILDDLALLFNICIDLAKVIQEQIDPVLKLFPALAAWLPQRLKLNSSLGWFPLFYLSSQVCIGGWFVFLLLNDLIRAIWCANRNGT